MTDMARMGEGGQLPESPVDRGREGEAFKCQFPDRRCDLERHDGTGYCFLHIEIMRNRRLGVAGEVPAEAARLEAEIIEDEKNWLRTFGLTNPMDAFAGDTQ
jgi:hypothetical protein